MKNLFLLILSLLLTLGGKAQDITGDWHGTLEFPGTKLRLVFHISSCDGGYQATLDSPDQGAKGIPASSVRYNAPELEIQFASLQAAYKGTYENDRLQGTFTQMDQPISLNLGRQVIKRERPQEPKSPYPYYSEDITFQNPKAGISLAGTLTLPRKEGDFPAVILISGSGPQNRDEELMGHKPFLILADYLTRQGIAVLRYDDRGVGQSGGLYAQATTLDFAEDVAAAVSYLKTRPEVRKSALGLIGHSEGGMIAPIVAAQDKEIAFIVLLAGVGIPGKELLLQQSVDLLKASHAPIEYQEKIASVNRKTYEILTDAPEERVRKALDSLFQAEMPLLTQGQTLNTEQKKQFIQQMMTVLSPWFRAFVAFQPEKYLSRVKCPVLALNGEKDLQVNARRNLTAIYETMQKSGNNKVDTVYLPGLNHLFQTCLTGLTNEYAFIEETFSPKALKIIAEWIQKNIR